MNLNMNKQERKLFNQIEMRIRLLPDFPDFKPNEQFAHKFASAFITHFDNRITTVDVHDPNSLGPFIRECLIATSVLVQNEAAINDFKTWEEYKNFEKPFGLGSNGRVAVQIYEALVVLWVRLIAACVIAALEIARYERLDGSFSSTVFNIQMLRRAINNLEAA